MCAYKKKIFLAQHNDPFSPWHCRGYLPHFGDCRIVQSINFRLYDAIPINVIKFWRESLIFLKKESNDIDEEQYYRKLIEKYEDKGKGACFLRHWQVAAMMQNTLLFWDNIKYKLLAWCIMPNHVHMLLEVLNCNQENQARTLSNIMHSIKSYSANRANEILARNGQFWFRDYYDRYIRNQLHFNNCIRYIENNPVVAGLVKKPEQWRWSSAAYKEEKK